MSRPIAAAILATLAAVAASAWWLHRPEPAVLGSMMQPAAHKRTPALVATGSRSNRAAPRPAVVDDSSWDPELVRRVERKYSYLLTDSRLAPVQLAQLRELLLQREQLRTMAGPVDDFDSQLDPVERGRIEQALAALEKRIRALLDGAQYSRYESLRESDVEQENLSQYSGGISDFAPLNPQQERLILEARLRYKKRFDAGLRDFGLDRTSLSVEERNYAHRNVAQTLNEYRDSFLAEVRPSLSEDQYFLLSSYESTEFARELERQQVLINSK
jgi:hypothetical protein